MRGDKVVIKEKKEVLEKKQKIPRRNRVMTYVLRYWYLYLLALVSMVIAIVLDVLAPAITRSIIDDVIVAGRVEILMRLLLGLAGIGLGRAIFGYIKEFTVDVAACKIGCDIRGNLFLHIQKLSMGYFDKNNSGELLARVKDDVDKIWNATGFVGMLIAECTIHTVLVLTCMFSVSPLLTLVPLAVMPVVAWTGIRLEQKLGSVYEDISEENAQLNTVAQENLAGVRTVKAFAREEYEIQKFKKHNKKYYDLNMKQARTLAKYHPNISFYTKVLLVAVIIFGGIMVMKDMITIGQLGQFTEYANNIIWPMEMIGWLSSDFAAAVASNKKIQKILLEEPEIKNPELPVSMEEVKGEVEFSHVDLKLQSQDVLKDISFHVKPGGTLGIMGMTGAGKTSVINLLERFYDASGGCVKVDGVDVRRMDLETLRRNIAVVMQDVFLFSDTINENISIGRRGQLEAQAIRQAAGSACADGFIGSLSEQYDTVIGERGVGLSGGQKQRISIARALAKKTPVLVLDDSTSALDMETEFEIQKKLKELENTTKLIIAHRISAVRHADEIIVLDHGSIAERGTHETLMEKKGLYYATYCAQYDAMQYETELKGGMEAWL